jgi:hypothetical protein
MATQNQTSHRLRHDCHNLPEACSYSNRRRLNVFSLLNLVRARSGTAAGHQHLVSQVHVIAQLGHLESGSVVAILRIPPTPSFFTETTVLEIGTASMSSGQGFNSALSSSVVASVSRLHGLTIGRGSQHCRRGGLPKSLRLRWTSLPGCSGGDGEKRAPQGARCTRCANEIAPGRRDVKFAGANST